MQKSVAVVMVVFALGGAGFAMQWVWIRIVVLFALFALGLIYKADR